MTTRSQNGYVVDAALIRSATIPGTDVRVRLRSGAAGDLLLYAARRWHREVEPLRAPDGVLDCWGYAERNIRGSSTVVSNHASGTALDLRARAHPLGTDPAASFTADQRAQIRRILTDCRGALRWGGDYTGRKDPMHVEVIADERRCAEVLASLPTTTTGDDDMALTDEDIARIADAVWQRHTANAWGGVVEAQQILNGAEKRTAEILDALGRVATHLAGA